MRARVADNRPVGMGAFTLTRTPRTAGPAAQFPEGYPAAQIAAYLDTLSDARQTRALCGLCEWPGFTGTAGEARKAGLEHRRLSHPETFRRKRRLAPGYGMGGMGTKPLQGHSAEAQQAARTRGNRAASTSPARRKP